MRWDHATPIVGRLAAIQRIATVRTSLKSFLSHMCALFGRRALIIVFFVGLFGIIGGLGPANAHAPGTAVARSQDSTLVSQVPVSLSALERHASLDVFRSSRVSSDNGVDVCSSGCCCGMMCSAALPEPAPSYPLMYSLHGCLVAARELAPESAPIHGMLRPPEA